jgi:hypothetical protein
MPRATPNDGIPSIPTPPTECGTELTPWIRRPGTVVIVIVFATVCAMVGRGYSSSAIATILSAACAASAQLTRRTVQQLRTR